MAEWSQALPLLHVAVSHHCPGSNPDQACANVASDLGFGVVFHSAL